MTAPVAHKPAPSPPAAAAAAARGAASAAAEAPASPATSSAAAVALATFDRSNEACRRLIETQFHIRVTIDDDVVRLPEGFFLEKYEALLEAPSSETLKYRVHSHFSFAQAPAPNPVVGAAVAGIMHTLVKPIQQDSKALSCCSALAATPAHPLRVAVSCESSVEVRLPGTNACVFQTKYPTSVLQLAASLDGRYLAAILADDIPADPLAASTRGHIKISDMHTKTHLCTLRGDNVLPHQSIETVGCVFIPSASGEVLLGVYTIPTEMRTVLCVRDPTTLKDTVKDTVKGTIKDTVKGTIVANLPNFTLREFSLTPNGNQLFMLGVGSATSGISGTARVQRVAYVWNFTDKKCTAIPCPVESNFFGPVHLLALSDTQFIACFQPGFALGTHPGVVREMVYSVQLFDITTKTHTGLGSLLHVTSLVLGMNHTLFVATSDNEIVIFDLNKKQRLPLPIPFKPVEVYKAPNETQLVARALRLATTPDALVMSTNQTGVVNIYEFGRMHVKKHVKKEQPTPAAAPASAAAAAAPVPVPQALIAAATQPAGSPLELNLSFSGSQQQPQAAAASAAAAAAAAPNPSRKRKRVEVLSVSSTDFSA